MSNNIRELEKVGTFELSQPKMYISDPGYDKDVWCTKVVDNCLTGKWKASINVNHYLWEYDGKKGEDHRVASVYICHESKTNAVFRGIDYHGNTVTYRPGWEVLSNQIGVDSGQCGFFDFEKYGDNDLFEFDGKCGFGSKWYGNCCDATLDKHADIIANMGVNASSGFGDGCYVVFGHKTDGFYDAFVLYFLPDDDSVED